MPTNIAIRSHRARMRYTVMFLRMTGTEIRELAKSNPEVARELGHIAEQVEDEQKASPGTLPRKGGVRPPQPGMVLAVAAVC